jgi:hypothetical protein
MGKSQAIQQITRDHMFEVEDDCFPYLPSGISSLVNTMMYRYWAREEPCTRSCPIVARPRGWCVLFGTRMDFRKEDSPTRFAELWYQGTEHRTTTKESIGGNIDFFCLRTVE